MVHVSLSTVIDPGFFKVLIHEVLASYIYVYIYIIYISHIITAVPKDALAPNSAGPSADMVLISLIGKCLLKLMEISEILCNNAE